MPGNHHHKKSSHNGGSSSNHHHHPPHHQHTEGKSNSNPVNPITVKNNQPSPNNNYIPNTSYQSKNSVNNNSKKPINSIPSKFNNNLEPNNRPSSASALKNNNLRKKLTTILNQNIAQHELCFVIARNYNVLINYLSQIKFDSKEKLNAFLFLKGQLNSQLEYMFVKDTLIPELIVALGVEASEYSKPTQKPPATPSYNLTPLRVEKDKKTTKLIQLAPKLNGSGYVLFPLEFDSVSIITRLFYDLIKTSKKFFRLMNINVIYEKNGFQNLDFTSLKSTLVKNMKLAPAHDSFMKLKGIRNDWAHFSNTTTIPPHIIQACFIFTSEIYDHYLSITTPNSEANTYMKRRIEIHGMFEHDYKMWEFKSNKVTSVVAQFCQQPEKKKQSALRVVELLSNSLKNGTYQEKDLDKLRNEILLNLLPRSPQLLKEMQQMNERETPRQAMVFILLENEFQSRIRRDEQFVKAFTGTNLTDQKFVSKSVFFKSIVMDMKNEKDHRQVVFEKAYHYFILEKSLKNLKEHNFEDNHIQQFKQDKGINIPKDVYEIIMKEINVQVEGFRKLWVSIAIAFSSCSSLEIPDAIKYLSWSLFEMTSTSNKFTFPNIIKPYIALVTNYLCQFNSIMLSNAISSNDITILKTVTIRVCLASLLKFYNLSTEIVGLFTVAKEQVINMNQALLQQLEPEDFAILNADPQTVNRAMLLPVELNFSQLNKNERANISVEGCFAFSSYKEILDEVDDNENLQ